MSAKIIEIVILESIAAVLLLLAYLIGVKRKLNLIAGYGERTAAGVKGKDALARLIARACFLVALLSGLMPIATSLWGQGPCAIAMCIGAYCGFTGGVVMLMILQAHEFNCIA